MGELVNGGPAVLAVGEADDASTLATMLSSSGIRTEACEPGSTVARISEGHPEIVLVLGTSWDEPTLLNFIGRVRRAASKTEIVLIDECVDHAKGVSALHVGADDYLCSASPVHELAARLTAKLRRRLGLRDEHTHLGAGDLEIDVEMREVREGDRLIDLRRREFDLLVCLASRKDRVLTKRQILDLVWEDDADWVDPATVTEHVRRVRSKLNGSAGYIQTVHGVGYCFRSHL